MNTFLTRLRGALGVSATWGAVWAAIFAALTVVVGVLDPDSIDPGETTLRIAAIGAVYGAVSGGAFSGLLSLTERGRTLRDLSLGRAAVLGAVASAAFPLLTEVHDSMVILVCPIGAAIATASVAAAKRAELRAAADQATLPSAE